MTSGRQAKKVRKENEVIITLDLGTAQWLLGFLGALVAPIGEVLSQEVIMSHQVIKALEKGLDENTQDQATR